MGVTQTPCEVADQLFPTAPFTDVQECIKRARNKPYEGAETRKDNHI